MSDKNVKKKEVAENKEAGALQVESAMHYFAELRDCMHLLPHYEKIYLLLNRLFVRCLNEKTAHVRLNLGGTFAKIDYLLKELCAPSDLSKKINATRTRLRRQDKLTAKEKERFCRVDYHNLCQWIAFVFQSSIPAENAAYFPSESPQEDVPKDSEKMACDNFRMIVDNWDEQYVYGFSDATGADRRLKVAYAQMSYGFDGSYLQRLFFRGAQLNVVHPAWQDGIVLPQLIIFEPDYLVDISAIAACFTNYADSPVVGLLRKLRPQQSTEAIVLGNLAGCLLDEEIHEQSRADAYREGVSRFWKDNAVALLSVSIGADFHERARAQQEHIRTAINETLPQEVVGFNKKEGMLEPSFFSEMLGLQGRMDYLQLDYKVLIEQKSGNGDFPHHNFVYPKQQDAHYVQMLLYMALIKYNYAEQYKQNNGIRAFLLYSKYKNSLLSLGNAPELEFRAIQLRNRLVRAEIAYANEDGFKILSNFSSDHVNLKGNDSILWHKYQSSQINDLLQPIRLASDLERHYYYRFLSFIAKEHLLCKLGTRTKENSGFASKWHDRLDEKLQAGNIYDDLELLAPDAEVKGRIERVLLRFAIEKENDMSNFRAGDIVLLYPYEKGEEPDVRSTPVLRSTIEKIEGNTIELKLRSAQSDTRFFVRNAKKVWAIEHDFMEASFAPLYRSMHAFLSAPKERRDLLMLQRKPRVDRSLCLMGDYGDFNDLSLQVKRAQDLFLIIGPPGTGKTSFGMLNTLKEELLTDGSQVLLLSYTNRAVDEICSKLWEEGIDFVRLGGATSCSVEYHGNLLDTIAKGCNHLSELKTKLERTRVVVATTTAMNSLSQLFQLKQFSLAIIDEASQILEPHLIGLLSAHVDRVPAIRKMVFIGDHKQLPAVVQQSEEESKVDDEDLNAILLTDCRLSLFERLLKRYHQDKDVVYMLHKQGRMHPDIAQFPNMAFYGGMLDVVPRPHQLTTLPGGDAKAPTIDRLLQTRRLLFFHAATPRDVMSDKVNLIEARMIANLVLRIYNHEKNAFDAQKTVGIIVPYRNQIATIRHLINRLGIKALHDVTIDTVERYQGSQRKYIVYGFTIQKYYQLNFLTNHTFVDWDGCVVDRKLNVAMTRAEEHLIMVGNTELLSQSPVFHRMIAFTQQQQGYFRVPINDFLSDD